MVNKGGGGGGIAETGGGPDHSKNVSNGPDICNNGAVGWMLAYMYYIL